MDELIKTIINQTKILFANIETTLDSIDEGQFYNTEICDWTLGEQIYHMLHSLDQWFINPNCYNEPSIAQHNTAENVQLNKQELIEFYSSIKSKISNYLEHLDPKEVTNNPPDCRYNRLTLVLGQYRHLICTTSA
jgi:hypothetical protein